MLKEQSAPQGGTPTATEPSTGVSHMSPGTEDTLMCSICRSNEFLVFESAAVYLDVLGHEESRWETTFWCEDCGSFTERSTHVPPHEAWLLECAATNPIYLHCGRRMHPGPTPRSARNDLEEALTFWCECGVSYQVPRSPDERY